MIILGVDPGTLVTGYGVIERSDGRLRVLEFDVVKNRPDHSMPTRLKAIYTTLVEVIRRFRPDEFAIETAFYGKNAQSALKIGHARGVSILAAVNAGLEAAEYSPREVKKAVVGNGGATKVQVEYMVRSMLRLRETPRFHDASDALAVALCHAQKANVPHSLFTHKRRKRHGGHSTWSAFIREHPHRVVKPR